MTRTEGRKQFSKYLNALDNDELFERFGITRVGELTGLDCIGIPVWSACRPASKTVSVSAGKSQDQRLARAGSVAESIEFATFENPVGDWFVGPYKCEGGLWPLAKGSTWNTSLPIAQEVVINLKNGCDYYFPSDLIWLDYRNPHADPHFQTSSNGQAVGFNFSDALLAALYEVIERDAITCRVCSWQEYDRKPPRVDISDPPMRLAPVLDACTRAGATVFLFYATIDINVPVYWAILVDPVTETGTFAGWGCDIDHVKAAERAILEAIQSRAVYIAGARDDILRRNFDLVKYTPTKVFMDELGSLPYAYRLSLDIDAPISLDEELGWVLTQLGEHFDDVYFKHVPLGDIHAVKAVVLGLEGVRSHDLWTPTRWLKIKEQACATAPSIT